LQVALGLRESITIFGDDYPTPDGTCIRDYIHVDDLGAAHVLALDKLIPGAGLKLNLGSGQGYSVREIINACRRITGKSIPEVVGPRRAGDPPALLADATRARDVLVWSPRHSELDEIITTAWRWHSAHPQGYGDQTVRARR